ncbi:MAG: tannase/feruloyl esterase family alpha/beta hydrolase [Bryobacterales bacterium]|nr:tannase/feruloyl esterase family alpha/beta hydrolase [Bryobacterales bacterium]
MKASLLSLFLMSLPVTGAAASCDSLGSLQRAHTTITSAATVPAGQMPKFEKLPAFCRVQGVLKPTSDSHIEFEVWMPEAGWNGRYQGIGNGGYAGSLSIGGVAAAVRAGYAASTTDTGHKAGGADGQWAVGHPEKLIDYGHRAIHETALVSKDLIAAFYGQPAKKSYFSSCSNGGRQALMEAQRYPEDYDGIVSGAPAAYMTRLTMDFVYNLQALSADGAHIPASKLPAIEKAALAACDAEDGVADNVIDSPHKCRFDPAVLLCKGTPRDDCLTAPQVEAVRRIQGGMKDSKGKLLYPGFPPGSETGQGGWVSWITGPELGKSAQAAFGLQMQRSFVGRGQEWDYRAFNFDKDVMSSEDKVGPLLDAVNPDLTAFHKRGGKLILWHGWNDPAIPAGASIQYWEAALKKMGKGPMNEFARFFLVPGMQHCGGGPGATQIGAAAGSPGDATNNVVLAVEKWVEEGVAPNQIIAKGNKRTRPLCPYPKVAKYKGTGSTDEAANFVCK